MQLTLRILSYRNQPVPPAPVVSFGPDGGSIGRSPDNALVLDDPGKYISRVHARVLAQESGFVLEDLGSNASVVNDRPLGKGQQVTLAHGDRVLIGDYLLQAVVDTAPAAPVLPPPPANNAKLPLFEPPPVAAPAPLPPLETTAPQPPAAAPAPGFLDPLTNASILDVTPGQRGGLSNPLGLDLFAPAPAGPVRAAESDHLSPELGAMPCSQAVPPPARQAAAPAASRFEIPEGYNPLLGCVEQEPLPVAPAPSPSPPPPPSPPAVPASTVRTNARVAAAERTKDAGTPDSEILAALLRGLGLPDLQLKRPPAETAEIVGAMLREATAGTIDVLMARALTKKESRIDMTMLSVRANNPLKFFPNADAALTQMLTGSMPGYMEPVEAMSGAFDDLRAHELAVIAGMRAALGAVLQRFDPAAIEARLSGPTMMDKVLSSSRKARLWDRLVEMYGEIAHEADDDLQRLYGEKFSEAYEEQVARLRRNRQKPE
jgi:FHA domain-containing protein/type VI secretion system protein